MVVVNEARKRGFVTTSQRFDCAPIVGHREFVHGIKVLIAKNYVDNLSEETKKGMREKAEQGIWPSFAPLGYRNVVGSDGRRIIEPDPHVAPLVRQLFELYATGRWSLRKQARWAPPSADMLAYSA